MIIEIDSIQGLPYYKVLMDCIEIRAVFDNQEHVLESIPTFNFPLDAAESYAAQLCADMHFVLIND